MRPIAVATDGFITAASLSPLSVATAGYLTTLTIPVSVPGVFFDSGGRKFRKERMLREKREREDIEIIKILKTICGYL